MSSFIPSISWLIPVFPFLGAIILGLLGKKYIKEKAHLIGVGSVALSFVISVLCFFYVATTGHGFEAILFEWIGVGNIRINAGFLVDQLTTVMLLVVTGVGLLVHIYSIGYMKGEEGYYRFFSYMNLFMFSMLILIMGNSYMLMFLGWEGVGLCSYCLIGYYFNKKSAADAGKKAFVVNRVGDAGFLMGAFFIFTSFGSFDYVNIFPDAQHTISESMATIITLCLFVGAMGKSAQIPLYVWLPDAMEGPTPVSALIHAATMVTAGIYMIVRSNVLFSMAPITLAVVATVGALTAIFAASMALVQNDIKKVLAYSTISQLGYMFLGCGVGAYIPAIFHLMTHAFFKGLLFLGSGSVIYAMHHEQDMRKMGGLFKRIPITAKTFLVGTIAIAGVPPLAGFWSKDEILGETFKGGHYILWAIGMITALMTAFYMFRLFFMTFAGKSRVDAHTEKHMHEPPKSMTTPLIILAVLSALGGFIPGWPPEAGWIHDYLGKILGMGGHAAEAAGHGAATYHFGMLDGILMGLSVLAGVTGIAIAWFLYILKPELPGKIAEGMQNVYLLLYNKYWVDEIYEVIFVNGCKKTAHFFWSFDKWIIDGIVNGVGYLGLLWSKIADMFDKYVVDGGVNGVSFTANFTGAKLKVLQSGNIQHYLLAMIIGICVILSIARLAFL